MIIFICAILLDIKYLWWTSSKVMYVLYEMIGRIWMKLRVIKTWDKFQKQKKLRYPENISDEDPEAQRLSDLTQGQITRWGGKTHAQELVRCSCLPGDCIFLYQNKQTKIIKFKGLSGNIHTIVKKFPFKNSHIYPKCFFETYSMKFNQA